MFDDIYWYVILLQPCLCSFWYDFFCGYISDRIVFPIRLAGSEEAEDDGQWKLYFKLYCFLDVESMPKEGVEFAFMFEQVGLSPHVKYQWEHFFFKADGVPYDFLVFQAHESLTRGHFPAREETLQHLAALRLQFLYGDKTRVAWSLENVYPVGRLRSRILQFTKVGAASGSGQTLERRRTSFLDGTLRRGLKTGSMKKQRMEEEQMLEMWIKEEMSATRASIVEKWSRLSGLDQHQAMLKYMTVIKEWPGYGSTLFDVEVITGHLNYGWHVYCNTVLNHSFETIQEHWINYFTTLYMGEHWNHLSTIICNQIQTSCVFSDP